METIEKPCSNMEKQVFQEYKQEIQEIHKKITTIQNDMNGLKQLMLEMVNGMTVLLNPQIYNPVREYEPSREMITGIIELKK